MSETANGQHVRRPLDGVTVLDLSRIVAGPFAAQLLADLGARIIKLEHPRAGDESRQYGAIEVEDVRVSALFASLNADKESISIDLTQPVGVELLRRIAAKVDVVVHNFRPGVVERLGIGYDDVAALNPSVVYCSISGFGDSGPLREKAANDVAAQAFSGLMSITGEAGRTPVRVPVAITDYAAGSNAAVGILAALVERTATGRGCEVQTSLLESALALMGLFIGEYTLTGQVPKPLGSANRLGQPNQAFPTTDGWIVLSATSDGMWNRCRTALELDDLADDPRFESVAQRALNRDELIKLVWEATSARSTRECMDALEAHGVACAVINTVDQAMRDPQVQHLDQLEEVQVGQATVTTVRSAIRIDDRARPHRRVVPELGQHTAAVLMEFGLSSEEVVQLGAQGVVVGPGLAAAGGNGHTPRVGVGRTSE